MEYRVALQEIVDLAVAVELAELVVCQMRETEDLESTQVFLALPSVMAVVAQGEMVHLELQLMVEQSPITQVLHQVQLETERQIQAAVVPV
jgi:putative heme iron utilization protein